MMSRTSWWKQKMVSTTKRVGNDKRWVVTSYIYSVTFTWVTFWINCTFQSSFNAKYFLLLLEYIYEEETRLLLHYIELHSPRYLDFYLIQCTICLGFFFRQQAAYRSTFTAAACKDGMPCLAFDRSLSDSTASWKWYFTFLHILNKRNTLNQVI